MCTSARTDVLIVYANSTAETELGEDALLHCRFETGKPNYKGDLVVIWRSDDKTKGPIIFQCLNSNCSNVKCLNSNCSNSVGRFSLVGNIEDSNVSLLIKNTTKKDEKQYYCRVEMAAADRYTAEGTLLTLTGQRKGVLYHLFIQQCGAVPECNLQYANDPNPSKELRDLFQNLSSCDFVIGNMPHVLCSCPLLLSLQLH